MKLPLFWLRKRLPRRRPQAKPHPTPPPFNNNNHHHNMNHSPRLPPLNPRRRKLSNHNLLPPKRLSQPKKRLNPPRNRRHPMSPHLQTSVQIKLTPPHQNLPLTPHLLKTRYPPLPQRIKPHPLLTY